MPEPTLISSVADKLELATDSARVIVGFDGFIDEIIHLVDKRHDLNSFERILQISDYGKRISEAAGLSCNIEMVSTQIKLGGNGPILANNLIAQGYELHYIGALGDGAIHPVFQPFVKQCASVVSLADPAHTDALEFHDGKIMMGKMESLKDVTWERLTHHLSESLLTDMLGKTQLISFNNWTMLPFMDSFFEGFARVLSKMEHRPNAFVDLTDPQKRSGEDVAKALGHIETMQQSCDVTFGMNQNESMQISDALLGTPIEDLTTRAERIRERLGLTQVVIHPSRSAGAASADGSWFLNGPWCAAPKLTTGAGDNFNAGYCTGLIESLSPEECLITGVSSSGFYVRNARSANRAELVAFMRTWADAGGDTFPDA
jgi:hypothetical protein